MNETRRAHWQTVYRNKEPTDVSWYQAVPARSIELIRSTGVARSEAILDAGGGASTLVDNLLDDGYEDITVMDISAAALQRSRQRLGEAAGAVRWIESDVTQFNTARRYAIWHDRAVFHFLTDTDEQQTYIDVMSNALQEKGHLLLATFGPEGPEQCSGLPVQRYSLGSLERLLVPAFSLRSYQLEMHETPTGGKQQFLHSWWQVTR